MNIKKLFAGGILSLIFVLTPAFAGAHGTGMMGFSTEYTPVEMMRYLEDEALGEEAHEEMEELMQSLFEGDLSQAEAVRLTSLMQEHPGPYGMMVGRFGLMHEQNEWRSNTWGGHMAWGYGFGWLVPLTAFVWLIVGGLVIVWLVRKLQNAK